MMYHYLVTAITICYVHLGENPAPTLISFAQIAREQVPEAEFVLITNRPKEWRLFPGELIEYDQRDRSRSFSSYIRRNRELEKIAGGYWAFTMERLFALQKMSNSTKLPILHFESDVFPLLRDEVLMELEKRIRKVAFPRISKTTGIASLLYSPNMEKTNTFLDKLQELLSKDFKIRNDMALLGMALNQGLAEELPTLPDQAWKFESKNGIRNIVFDGAALGQYLFGLDPYHTNNVRISGFQHPDFALDLKTTTWKLNLEDSIRGGLSFSVKAESYFPANLHIHSKEVIGPFTKDLKRWEQAILEAHRIIPRVSSEEILNLIHTKPVSMLNRLRIARKRGLKSAALSYLKRRLF